MTPNRRIFLNIVATYGRSLYALVIDLFCGRGTLTVLDALNEESTEAELLIELDFVVAKMKHTVRKIRNAKE